jgi:putative ABC transport system permease protein
VFNLAWRNVWRNRRRSLITMTSMGFGLSAIMFGQSMIKTLQGQLVEKATGSITGHLQIQNRHIKDYKIPDKYIEDPAAGEAALAADPRVKAFAKRITMTGLVASPTGSVGALICGIEPRREREVTTMSTYVTAGEFLGDNPKGVVMGEKLAQRLDLKMGEKVVVMAQAVDGSMGAEAFRLVGLYRSGSETFDSQIIYIPLAATQELLAAGKRISNFAMRVNDLEQVDMIQQDLGSKLSREPVQVLSWKNIDHEIVGVQKFQNGLLDVVLTVVFLIVALGILNTLLMSLFERVREFGVLMAMGAKPGWVMRLVLIESVSLGAVGTVLGLIIGSAMIAYYGRRGLHLPVGDALSYFLPFPSTLYLQPAWESHLFAAGSVLFTSLVAAIPPALRACRLKPAEALRHV